MTVPGQPRRPAQPLGVVHDALAPLLLLAAVGLGVLATVDVWVAAGTAAFLHTGRWAAPPWHTDLLVRLLRAGPPGVFPRGVPTMTFLLVAAALAVPEAAVLVVAGVLLARRGQVGDPRRALLGRRELGDLTGPAALARARQLRPSLADQPSGRQADRRDRGDRGARGVRLLRVHGRDVWMSWEDVALIIMGPRANKTSAVAVPTVLSAPGPVVATSNKADLWALTAGLRARVGPVFTFDPQQIAFAEQTWWWDPLRAIRDADPPARVDAAARLAGHFLTTLSGARKDPFFTAAAEQVLTGTLLAAAVSGATLRDVVGWLQDSRRHAVTALDTAGAHVEAGDLEATLGGAEVTTKGIYQTARTATKALTSERILRWITPPHTWRTPPPPGRRLLELDVWQLLTPDPTNNPADHPTGGIGAPGRAPVGAPTVHLLSKEGAGTAAPVVDSWTSWCSLSTVDARALRRPTAPPHIGVPYGGAGYADDARVHD